MARAIHGNEHRQHPEDPPAGAHRKEASAGRTMFRGIRLGRIAGITVRIDWSLFIVFWLIASSLALGVFPAWHPDWSGAQAWGTAFAAALLFFSSVLAHELSHAIVGRRQGMQVNQITLFIFGGVAELGSEPPTWRAELWMTIVGPATSIVLGALFLALASSMAPPGPTTVEGLGAWFAQLSPAATLLQWLGQVNIILALFNLVPGFPLDGGRILRAALWGITGNVRKATRWASLGGQIFAWILISAGLAMILGVHLPVFGSGLVGGLWLAFIGWFLNNAAITSYRQLLVQESLRDVPVRKLMQTLFTTVRPDMTVAELVEQRVLPSGQRAFPVVEGAQLAGMVCLQDVRKVDRSAWHTSRVSDIMTPASRLATLSPEQDAFAALAAMGQSGVNQLPVVQGVQLQGLLRREDLLKWLALYGEDSLKAEANV